MQTVTPLEPGEYYHIYNRGVNRTNIFIEERNFDYFMQLYARHVAPVADTFAYCLLRNHFHLLVRIRACRRRDLRGLGDLVGLDAGLDTPVDRDAASQAFSNWLNAYAKGINKAYGRTGTLFEHRFRRLPVTSERHFVALIHYIHRNPQKHGFEEDFCHWPYSSYHALVSDRPTRLERTEVLSWFGGPQELRESHGVPADETLIQAFIGEDAP